MTPSSAPHDAALPPRILHLAGGLRAIDDRTDQCAVQINAKNPLVRFPAPEYSQLYLTLSKRGLIPLGVEFVNAESYQGISAPDWQCASPAGGFRILTERNEWANIRHTAHKDGNRSLADAASRCKTYLDLLSIRVLDLSDAYNRTLNEWHSRGGKVGHFFDNSRKRYIDAAIHAFASDAGAFRDLIAEIVWRFVLNESGDVTTLATFLKLAKTKSHPLAVKIVKAGQPGGWLKVFTDLRNDLVHVAPVGRSQTFHFCRVSEIAIADKIAVPVLHYALLCADGSVRKEDGSSIDWEDEAAIKAELERYRQHFDTSIDGLDYAWRTIGGLVDLLQEARIASGVRAEMVTITDDDIVGDVTLI